MTLGKEGLCCFYGNILKKYKKLKYQIYFVDLECNHSLDHLLLTNPYNYLLNPYNYSFIYFYYNYIFVIVIPAKRFTS